MIKGDIEIRCNDCSASFFVPIFNILMASDNISEIKKIISKEGWFYKKYERVLLQRVQEEI